MRKYQVGLTILLPEGTVEGGLVLGKINIVIHGAVKTFCFVGNKDVRSPALYMVPVGYCIDNDPGVGKSGKTVIFAFVYMKFGSPDQGVGAHPGGGIYFYVAIGTCLHLQVGAFPDSAA